jgi:hypothetical protein
MTRHRNNQWDGKTGLATDDGLRLSLREIHPPRDYLKDGSSRMISLLEETSIVDCPRFLRVVNQGLAALTFPHSGNLWVALESKKPLSSSGHIPVPFQPNCEPPL